MLLVLLRFHLPQSILDAGNPAKLIGNLIGRDHKAKPSGRQIVRCGNPQSFLSYGESSARLRTAVRRGRWRSR